MANEFRGIFFTSRSRLRVKYQQIRGNSTKREKVNIGKQIDRIQTGMKENKPGNQCDNNTAYSHIGKGFYGQHHKSRPQIT